MLRNATDRKDESLQDVAFETIDFSRHPKYLFRVSPLISVDVMTREEVASCTPRLMR